MLQYQIDGFDLDNKAAGFQLVGTTSYTSGLSMRRVNVEIPRMHGTLALWDDPMSAATLILDMKITASSAGVLDQRYRYLLRLLGVGAQRPVTVRRTTAGGTETAQAQLVTTSAPIYTCTDHLHMIKTLVTMNIPSGRWTAEGYIEHTITEGTGIEVPFVSDSTAPVTDLQIRITGPVTSFTLDDDVSGTGVRWFGGVGIPSGEYLLIDCGEFTAWRNTTSSWTAQETSVIDRLSVRGNGMLAPSALPELGGGGTSSLTLDITGTGAVVVVRGRRTTT